MSAKNEFLFDFGISMPRILVAANTAVLDNVKKIVMISDNSIVVDNGKGYTTLKGRNFIITEICDGRMLVEGEIQGIDFYKSLFENKDRGISD